MNSNVRNYAPCLHLVYWNSFTSHFPMLIMKHGEWNSESLEQINGLIFHCLHYSRHVRNLSNHVSSLLLLDCLRQFHSRTHHVTVSPKLACRNDNLIQKSPNCLRNYWFLKTHTNIIYSNRNISVEIVVVGNICLVINIFLNQKLSLNPQFYEAYIASKWSRSIVICANSEKWLNL